MLSQSGRCCVSVSGNITLSLFTVELSGTLVDCSPTVARRQAGRSVFHSRVAFITHTGVARGHQLLWLAGHINNAGHFADFKAPCLLLAMQLISLLTFVFVWEQFSLVLVFMTEDFIKTLWFIFCANVLIETPIWSISMWNRGHTILVLMK